jgi:uncharacterized Zn-finger protein
METLPMSNAAVETRTEHELIEVSRKDLPLCCPLPGAPVWNMHPRVYLPIEDEPNHEATCPYCGARYRLR